MIRIFLLSLLTLISSNAFAQISWVRDLKTAQVMALSSEKLIVMDFWAVWCGPCRVMDDKLWSLPEMEQLSKNFVALKVDIDADMLQAQQYRATSIPKVVIASAAGEIIYEKVGFRYADEYLSVLRAIPESVGDLNHALLPVLHNQLNSEALFHLGSEYQNVGRKIENESLRDAFLNQSDLYFKKAIKKNDDRNLAEEAKLQAILNEAYREKAGRAMKRLAKLEHASQDQELLELKHFIAAYCYKCMGEEEKLSEERKQISRRDYLKQLE